MHILKKGLPLLRYMIAGTLLGILLAGMDPVHAQEGETPPKALRLTWDPNPADQGVKWYTIWYRDGNIPDSVLIKIDATSTINDNGKVVYVKSLNEFPLTLEGNDIVCFRTRAHTDDEESPYSGEVCGTIVFPDVILTAPGGLLFNWIY